MFAPEIITIEHSRIVHQADHWARYFRYYDELLDAGLSVEEAIATVEAAQADECTEQKAIRI